MKLLLMVLAAAGLTAFSAAAQTPAPPAAVAAAESEAAFLARCRAETLRRDPQAARYVDGECKARGSKVRASQPIAEAMLSLVRNAGGPRDAAAIRSRLPGVTFSARPVAGKLTGRQGALEVVLTGAPQVDSVAWSWSAVGKLIPYEVDQALIGRGVALTLVGCQALGAGEITRVYRATPRGGAPFGLHIYQREAPTANANAAYSVTADLNGRIPTLAALNARGDEFTAACPD